MKGSNLWSNVFDVEEKRKRLKILEEKFSSPSVWQDKPTALKWQQEIFQIKQDLDLFDLLNKEANDLKELSRIISTEAEEESFSEKLTLLAAAVKERVQGIFLAGKYDRHPAIMIIQSGTGGRDAEDWVALLLNMYQRYCEKKGWNCRILSQNFTEGGGPEGRIGIKEVVLEIKGELAYGLLKRETGVHRLVRLSPFSAKKLRHTSFAQVEMMPLMSGEVDVVLRPEDLKLETFRSAGHGGQNVNKRETAVRLTHLPTGLSACAQVERTQIMNKKIALNLLSAKIAALQEVQKNQEMQNERAKIRGNASISQKRTADFGQQIRSYVAHPYKMVKDHRTNVEVNNVNEVLNGNLDVFIEAELRL